MASEVLVRPRAGVTRAQVAAAFDGEVLAAGNSGWVRVRSRSLGASALMSATSNSNLVSETHPNYILRITDTLPADPEFSNLYGLRNTGQTIKGQAGVAGADISAVKAWDITIGTRSTLVGVVDTGIDYNHPDLVDNVWSAPAPYTITIGSNTYTCPAGSHGFNAYALNCDPLDDNNHGTHVSGTIGARGNNNLGVAGVNWKASLVGIKILNQFGFTSSADAINGLEAAIQMKAQGINIRVLNASWGTAAASPALEQAIAKANANDILFVASAGNAALSNDVFPAYPGSFKQPNIVSVAATDNRDQLAAFSSFGPTTVHLGAPGVNVLSTFIGGAYQTLNGTSMAAPHVTGSVALILSRCALNTAALKQLLLNSVDPLPSLAGLTISGGRLNVYRALQQCGATAAPDFQLSASPSNLSIIPGETATTRIDVQQLFGLTGSVTLSVTGLPAGVTPLILPGTVTGSGSAMLSFAVDPSTVRGTYAVMVNGVDSAGTTNSVRLSLAIFAPEFALSGSSTAQLSSLAPLSLPVSVASIGGFNGVVQLAASGLPAGVTASFTPPTVTGSGFSTMTLTASPQATVGNTTITVQGASGALVRTMTIALSVVAPPDMSVTLSPAVLNLAPGGPGSTDVTIVPLTRFTSGVTLSAAGLPPGFTATFSPSTLPTTSGTSTLSVVAAANATPGSYPVSVQATAGTLVRTATLQLNVVALPVLTVTLPATVDVGATTAVNITLPAPAPVGGLDVTVTTSNAAVGTLNRSTIFIPGGQPSSTRVTLTGASAGLTTVTALANGYGPGSATVRVGAVAPVNGTLTFAPAALTLSPGASQTLNLLLSPPAPAAGLLLSLISNNPLVASVPFVLNVPGNATTLPVPVTALSAGSATINAAAPNYTLTTASITVSNATPVLLLTTTSLATGQAGQPYTQTLAAMGGTPPYGWTISGSLPNGLSLNPATGVLSGTPTVAVSSLPLTFRVADAAGQSAMVTLPLTIQPAPSGSALRLPASLSLTAGQDATLLIELPGPAPSGGVLLTLGSNNPLVASVNVAALFIPAGLSNTTRARVTGLSAGNALITVSADGYAPATTSIQVGGGTGTLTFLPGALSLVAPSSQNVPLTLSPPAPAGGLLITFSSTNASVATAPLTLLAGPNASSVSVPVSVLAAGNASITAAATGYTSASTALTVSGAPPPLSILATPLAAGEVGQFYSQRIAASGGTQPYQWSVVGSLPAGLTLNSQTGVLSGLPALAGSSTILIRVSDAGVPVQSVTLPFSLTINPAKPAGNAVVLPPLVSMSVGTETTLVVSLPSPAPAGGVDLVLTNSSPSIAGLNVIYLFLPAGQTTTTRARLTGLTPGQSTISVSAPGYATANTVVQVN
ncbi:MAG: S8 family serine peptidase [Bryobacteraceae bacterium]|nr:S8 family serine peptidase [Bryobacteraceae bacterium]